ncbi:MAG: dienelactone hydrolase family protein [Chloroflexi bacterium]|nr:dienelactone hydrolase family protein [Chloroflexota bacterium]MCI0576875.1 dienelactone hydrolase family protein [Chloroflexota bacterium]MCI0646471.1 dienelactone hydrolase family protein [Chloroflexota bacterium]MCI0726177.1 dienelactone hydrolase family protein [Chloroflexota bacterium]
MKQLNPDQKYFVEEFYEDYREGMLSRREFVKRVAFITGSIAATIATMGLVGCEPEELPEATEPMPTPEPPSAAAGATAAATTAGVTAAVGLTPVPGAQSPSSVPEGDPAVAANDVTLTSQGTEISAYLARPAADGVYPAVMVCHENRGLTVHIRDVARRFARAGYVALAIDLLSREGGSAALDPDQIPGLLSNAPPGQHVADFSAGFTYLQGLDFVDGGRIGMTGYCFGGGVTWDVATALPELKAAVPFYGRGPELAAVANIRAAVLGVYAEQDGRINAGIEALEQALTEAGVTYQFNIYPGVDHAFHNDTGSRYVEEQATQAWMDTLAWFEMYL